VGPAQVIKERVAAYGRLGREYHRVTVAWARRLWACFAALVTALAITALANAALRVVLGTPTGGRLTASIVGLALLFVVVAVLVYRSTITAPARKAAARERAR
jgi:hypothetical protein